MKKKELEELRQGNIKNLKKVLEKKQLEKIKVKMQLKTGQLKNVKQVWSLRKEIAQILTLIREKEIKGEN